MFASICYMTFGLLVSHSVSNQVGASVYIGVGTRGQGEGALAPQILESGHCPSKLYSKMNLQNAELP